VTSQIHNCSRHADLPSFTAAPATVALRSPRRADRLVLYHEVANIQFLRDYDVVLSRTAPGDPLVDSTLSTALPSAKGPHRAHRKDRLQAPPRGSVHRVIGMYSRISKQDRLVDSLMYQIGYSSPLVAAALGWRRAPSVPPVQVRRRSLAGFLLPGRRRRFGALSLRNRQGCKHANFRPNSASKYGRRLTQSLCVASTRRRSVLDR
jgi:hypothetical protein